MERSPAALDVGVVERANAVAAVKAGAVSESHMAAEGFGIHIAGMLNYKDLIILFLRDRHISSSIRIETPYALDCYRGAKSGDTSAKNNNDVPVDADRAELPL